ncbi:MAG: phospho-N-acetylmuramoyl-pentapeptide-transferase [Elusimicrobiota bacterium]|jgi:phospho-N-acetylmuramoyl-pentapeptide-transferase|nr:phospho-N-acetylmuramoyl-pentapeptide-transferase [Elusimicrobiota bacterium]
MFYYFTAFVSKISALNVFQYITFRAGGAVVTGFLLTFFAGPFVIKKLSAFKISQMQRADGPKSHLGKGGTPTMGGILIIASLILTVLMWARLDNRFIWLLLFVAVMLSAVGIFDDYTKIIKKNSKGAPSWVKLAVQIITAFAVVAYLAAYPPNMFYAASLSIPYASSKIILNLGGFYLFFAMLTIVGSSNATNLTDGLDGLVSGSVIFCACAYAVFAYAAGNFVIADYLKLIFVSGAGEITVFLSALIGACTGFLWYNAYPAQVFMGDTSSLMLGGVIATSAICVKQELILPVAGGIFVLETLSVILQMGYFKATKGRRLLRMAPLHHHFELKGVQEPKVIVRFWIAGIVLMLMALASLKIR